MAAIEHIRVLVVDDYEPFRKLVCSMLERRVEFQVIGQASDGLEAIEKAAELKPDLILLDIGLPKLNGIQTARHLRKLVPDLRILFFSQYTSSDVVQEALGTGALGYVHKSRAHSELLPAIETVLRGNRFVGGVLEEDPSRRSAIAEHPSRHEVQFCSDEVVFLESYADFAAAALNDGKAVIVVLAESHRQGIFQRLQAKGLDVAAAIEKGALIPLGLTETLSIFMVDGMPDPARLSEAVSGVVQKAAMAASRDHEPRVAMCGGCGHRLWAEGKRDAAIQIEQLLDQLTRSCKFDVLCAYPMAGFEKDSSLFQSICASHSGVYSR